MELVILEANVPTREDHPVEIVQQGKYNLLVSIANDSFYKSQTVFSYM